MALSQNKMISITPSELPSSGRCWLRIFSQWFACVIMALSAPVVIASANSSYATVVPTVSSFTPSNPARSRRIILHGSGFGFGGGQLLIGGVPAHIADWSDQRIAAFVAESTPLGTVNVELVSGGTTLLGSIAVLDRPGLDGRILWRFDGVGLYFATRPAVGPNGNVYANDTNGHLYALTPEGALRWVRPGVHGTKSATISSTGELYVAGLGSLLTRLNPADGSTIWSVGMPSNAGAIYAGPNVGPSGDVYIATNDSIALGHNFGVAAISPSGQLLWSRSHSIGGSAGSGANAFEIAPGPAGIYVPSGAGTAGGGGNATHMFALDPSNGNVQWTAPSLTWPRLGNDGNLYLRNVNANFYASYDPGGSQLWQVHHSTIGGTPTGDIALDSMNSFFVGGGPNISAGDSNGQQLWRTVLDQAWATRVGVSSTKAVVVASVTPLDFGASKTARGYDKSNGQELWSQDLGFDGGVRIFQSWNGSFSPDESVWYMPCSGNNQAIEPRAPLIAVLVAKTLSIGTNFCGPSVVNSTGQSAHISALGSVDATDNSFALRAEGMPAGKFGIFFNSAATGFVMNPGGSQGNLCLSGAIARHPQILSTGQTGSFELPVDLSVLPRPGGPHAVLAGETWVFQAWFRDQNPVNTSNYTDGLTVQFQ